MENISDLQKEANEILESCAHWKSCQDGSYEMALTMAGYFEVIKRIKNENKR